MTVEELIAQLQGLVKDYPKTKDFVVWAADDVTSVCDTLAEGFEVDYNKQKVTIG